jgi:hypothetical protein
MMTCMLIVRKIKSFVRQNLWKTEPVLPPPCRPSGVIGGQTLSMQLPQEPPYVFRIRVIGSDL